MPTSMRSSTSSRCFVKACDGIEFGLAHADQVHRGPESSQQGLGDAQSQSGGLLLGSAVGSCAVLLDRGLKRCAGRERLANSGNGGGLVSLEAELRFGRAGDLGRPLLRICKFREQFRIVLPAFDIFEGACDDGVYLAHLQIAVVLQNEQDRLFYRQVRRSLGRQGKRWLFGQPGLKFLWHDHGTGLFLGNAGLKILLENGEAIRP
jgi:hypothetical protein